MINVPIKKLLKRLKDITEKKEIEIVGVPKIKLSKMIGKMAFIYEKIRNAIDYSDEQLLRKNAIKRILKRRLISKVKAADISRLLINELIRARYLEDNTVPETKVNEVMEVINKFIILFNELNKKNFGKELSMLNEFAYGLLASEVETILVSPMIDNAYIQAFYQTIEGRILVKEKKIISQRELDLQTYLAIVRLVSNSDNEMLSFRILKLYYPNWTGASKQLIEEIAKNFTKLKRNSDIQINHPIGKYILKNLKPYSVYFTILRDIIEDEEIDKYSVIIDEKLLADQVKAACNKKYKKIKQKLNNNVIRSIIYIFLTKMFLAIILELPFDYYLYNHINFINLGINIVFPPALLFLITMSARVPSDNNTQKIIEGIKNFVFEKDKSSVFEIKRSYGRSTMLNNLFKFIYTVTFLLSYGIIIKILYELNFNILNGFLFLLFLSIVSYFGIRVKTIAKEMLVIPQKENILTFLLDIFSYPIIRVGKWVSVKFSKINIFAFVLDFIIEAPFKLFVEIIEDWFSFVKEKKEEIY